MKDIRKIKEVVIDGHSLTLEDLVAAARGYAKVSLADSAKKALEKSRKLIEKIAGEKRRISEYNADILLSKLLLDVNIPNT